MIYVFEFVYLGWILSGYFACCFKEVNHFLIVFYSLQFEGSQFGLKIQSFVLEFTSFAFQLVVFEFGT